MSDGIIKMIRDLIEEIKSGKIDADEAASTLMEMVSSGSVGGFIAGGLVQGYTGTPFPVGTRDRNGIPRKPSWGNAAEQKSAENLPGRKRHKKRRKHHRVHESTAPHEVRAYHVGAANYHWRKGNREEARKHSMAAHSSGVYPTTYDPRFAVPEMEAQSDAAYKQGEKDAETLSAHDHKFLAGHHFAAIHFIKSEMREPGIVNHDELKSRLRRHEALFRRHDAVASWSSERQSAGGNSFKYPEETAEGDRHLLTRAQSDVR